VAPGAGRRSGGMHDGTSGMPRPLNHPVILPDDPAVDPPVVTPRRSGQDDAHPASGGPIDAGSGSVRPPIAPAIGSGKTGGSLKPPVDPNVIVRPPVVTGSRGLPGNGGSAANSLIALLIAIVLL
jgi:hypothetical protein